MTAWLGAAAVALALTALTYLPVLRGAGGGTWGVAALRAAALLVLAGAALDAPLGGAVARAPLVVLDASASWTRAASGEALRAARDSARAIAPDSLLLAGDSLRRDRGASVGGDVASRLADAAERAAAAGRPLVVITDGEADDANSLAAAPRGSRTVTVRPARGDDVAVVEVDAPRALLTRDTVDVRATLAADAGGAAAGRLRVTIGGRVLADSALGALGAFGRRELRLRAPVQGLAAGPQVLRVVAAAPGDREPRNDTLALAVDVSDAPAAVFVSAAPDYDARLILATLRGTLGTPVRAYLRIAPGRWSAEGTLAGVSEGEVRRAAAGASLLVLHGDTAALGSPRALGAGALALVAPPTAADSGAEWSATAAPPSPVSGALADVVWDSLPPLDVGPAPTGGWRGLTARGPGGATRAIFAGSDAGRRVVVVRAGGFWRWQFRAGRAADAATALWGAVFDWLAAGRGDARAAVPERAAVRVGEPIAWRRGGADSVVRLTLASSGATARRTDTLTVRFASGARTAETPPVPAGVYDVRTAGGASLLVVNASGELLPRRPSLRSGPIGAGAVTGGDALRLRDAGWPFAVAAGLLCAEWFARRRRGLR